MRYEIPALIVIDAESKGEAHKKAGELSRTLRQEVGPGAFFLGVGVCPTGLARECEEDRQAEPINAHVRSILAASPISYVSP